MADIIWKNTTNFEGRNGFFKCSGIELLEQKASEFGRPEATVQLYPVTSRGAIARCMIEVPKSAVPELIHRLQNTLKEG